VSGVAAEKSVFSVREVGRFKQSWRADAVCQHWAGFGEEVELMALWAWSRRGMAGER